MVKLLCYNFYGITSRKAANADIENMLGKQGIALYLLSKNDMPEPLRKATAGHSESMDTYGQYGHEVYGDLKRATDIIFENYRSNKK